MAWVIHRLVPLRRLRGALHDGGGERQHLQTGRRCGAGLLGQRMFICCRFRCPAPHDDVIDGRGALPACAEDVADAGIAVVGSFAAPLGVIARVTGLQTYSRKTNIIPVVGEASFTATRALTR